MDRVLQVPAPQSRIVAATSDDVVSDEIKAVDRIGNKLVGVVVILLGAAMVAGIAGVPFIHFIAIILMMALGALMLRGLFGDNATMGTLMLVLAPAAVIVPTFVPALMMLGPAISAFFVVAGIAKLPGLW